MSGAAGALDAAGRERMIGVLGAGKRGWRVSGGGCWSFLRELWAVVPWHRGCGAGSSQAYLGPRAGAFACSRPGDMMIDWVSPRLRGDAAAHSVQAVRVPCAAGRVAG